VHENRFNRALLASHQNEECGGRVVQFLGSGQWAVGCGLWEDLLVVSARVGEGGVRTPGGQLYVRTYCTVVLVWERCLLATAC